MKTNLPLPILIILASIFLTACVRDTDFDEADNIALTPVVELDLIYFTLTANDFFDSSTSNPRLTVSDTTDLPFLNEGFAQENLRKADFFFKFTNSIPRSFDINFQFLNPENTETYSTQTNVSQGTPQNPQPTDFTETVEGEELTELLKASKVVVTVTIESSNEELEGELNLKSKTTYYLEL